MKQRQQSPRRLLSNTKLNFYKSDIDHFTAFNLFKKHLVNIESL